MTDRDFNDERLQKAIRYLVSEGSGDPIDLYITRIQAIDEHILQQLPVQGKSFDPSLYRLLRSLVREVQDDVQAINREESSLDSDSALALVQVGPNDVLRGVAPAKVHANLAAVVRELRACGMPVLLTRVEPPAMLRVRAAPYQAIHGEVAREHGAALCDFFPAGVLGHPDMVLHDRVHPNARAIALVADHLLPHVEAALTRPRADAA
jgi:acyl-CoA thioesterase-1